MDRTEDVTLEILVLQHINSHGVKMKRICFSKAWYVKKYLAKAYSKLNLNNPKGASFKENRLMTTSCNTLGTTSIFRFSTYENNLNIDFYQEKYTFLQC
jgi:hypothetical protein